MSSTPHLPSLAHQQAAAAAAGGIRPAWRRELERRYIWSNTQASDSVLVCAMLSRPNFQHLLLAAVHLGEDFLERQFAAMDAARAWPSDSARRHAGRIVGNIKVGAGLARGRPQ